MMYCCIVVGAASNLRPVGWWRGHCRTDLHHGLGKQRVRRVEMYHRRVAFEPCELFLGIYTGVFLDAGHCGVVVHLTVEICKHFFESYSVERVETAHRIYLAGLVEQSVGHHAVDPCVDAAE